MTKDSINAVIPLLSDEAWLKKLEGLTSESSKQPLQGLIFAYTLVCKLDPAQASAIKLDFIKKLAELTKILQLESDVSYQHFAVIFTMISSCSFLDIHYYPRLDKFLNITKIKSKQVAMGMVRHAALDIFNTLMRKKIDQAAKLPLQDQLTEYVNLLMEIESALMLPLFTMPRSNWFFYTTNSCKNIESGVYQEVLFKKNQLIEMSYSQEGKDQVSLDSKHF